MSPPEPSDEELVRRCLAGERKAWNAFVGRFGPLVYGVALRTGLRADDAADVFQTVFAAAWRNLHVLQRPGSVSFWLARIARREAWHASRLLRPAAAEVDTAPAATPAEALPDAELERAEQALLVQRALGQLDARCGRLLRILFFEEQTRSYDEVARELGMPLGSLGPTRGRCLEKLRRALQELGFPE